VRSDISRSRKIAVPPPGMRYGRYSSCGSRRPPTSSRLNSMPTDRARTPSSDANQSRPALNIALAASGETEPSDGHIPRGFFPNERSCEAIASSIWKAASSGYANGGSGMIAFGSPRSALGLLLLGGRDDRVGVAAQRGGVVDDEGQDGVVVRRRQDLDLSVVLEPVVEVRNAR